MKALRALSIIVTMVLIIALLPLAFFIATIYFAINPDKTREFIAKEEQLEVKKEVLH